MKRRTALLLIVPIVLLLVVLLIPAVVSAGPGKAASDNAAVHKLIYDPDAGLTYNAIYHPKDGTYTVTGAIYPKSGPLKVK